MEGSEEELIFRFQQFNVIHSGDTLKVNTDSILFGAWMDPTNASSVLDVGTGNGILSLMLAQKNSHATILGVELNRTAFEQARRNFENSPWSDRLDVLHVDFQKFETPDAFDFICCNPPFFSNGLLSEKEGRRMARHQETFSLEFLLERSRELITPNGTLAFMAPTDMTERLLNQEINGGWYAKRICELKSKPNRPPHILMVTLQLTAGTVIKETLVIRDDKGNLSGEYMELTREYLML